MCPPVPSNGTLRKTGHGIDHHPATDAGSGVFHASSSGDAAVAVDRTALQLSQSDGGRKVICDKRVVSAGPSHRLAAIVRRR
jgi:hypothetical protein